MSYTQIKSDAPPAPIRPCAHFAKTPSEFAGEHGINFDRGTDDLGDYVYATVIVDGEPYALLRHVHSTEPGTDLYVAHDRDPVAAAAQFADALALGDPKWTHPGDAPPSYFDAEGALVRERPGCVPEVHRSDGTWASFPDFHWAMAQPLTTEQAEARINTPEDVGA